MQNHSQFPTIATNEQGSQVVSARELHQFLDNKRQFADWIKQRILEYEFIENQDYVTFSQNSEKGRPSTEYAITLDMAKELSMVERTEKGKQARKYFIEAEKQLRSLDIDKLASLVAQKLGVKMPVLSPANENTQVMGTGKTTKQINIEATLQRFKTGVETLFINSEIFYFYKDVLIFCGYNESSGGMYKKVQGYQKAKLAVRVGRKRQMWYLSLKGLKIFLKEASKSEAGVLLYAIEQKGGVL